MPYELRLVLPDSHPLWFTKLLNELSNGIIETLSTWFTKATPNSWSQKEWRAAILPPLIEIIYNCNPTINMPVTLAKAVPAKRKGEDDVIPPAKKARNQIWTPPNSQEDMVEKATETVAFKSLEWWQSLKTIQGKMKYIIAFDFETTGLETRNDQVVSLAFVCLDAKTRTIKTFESLVKPSIIIPEVAIDIHHISNEDVEEALPFEEVIKPIMPFISSECMLLGYNIHRFDLPMWFHETLRAMDNSDSAQFPEVKISLDLGILYKKWNKRKGSWKLSECYKACMGKPMLNNHDAMADAMACIEMLPTLAAYIGLPDLTTKPNGGKKLNLNYPPSILYGSDVSVDNYLDAYI